MAENYEEWQGVAEGGAESEAAPRSDDYQLAQRVAGGDMEAFEELYKQHYRRVYCLCLRMTANASEAEDLTQDVFVHVFRKIGGFRGEATFTTWLHRLTVNQVLMHFRRNKKRRTQSSEEVESPLEMPSGAEMAGRMPVHDQIALADALAQLSPGYRTVLILHDVEGYEHEEIARRLGCATGTSKSQLHKARMRLRKLLNARPTPRSLGFQSSS
ncbi:MAG: RNA polymerase sigma factor [Pyrinomonadaceae bacterium]